MFSIPKEELWGGVALVIALVLVIGWKLLF